LYIGGQFIIIIQQIYKQDQKRERGRNLRREKRNKRK
jgi:hypothetical protein